MPFHVSDWSLCLLENIRYGLPFPPKALTLNSFRPASKSHWSVHLRTIHYPQTARHPEKLKAGMLATLYPQLWSTRTRIGGHSLRFHLESLTISEPLATAASNKLPSQPTVSRYCRTISRRGGCEEKVDPAGSTNVPYFFRIFHTLACIDRKGLSHSMAPCATRCSSASLGLSGFGYRQLLGGRVGWLRWRKIDRWEKLNDEEENSDWSPRTQE